MKYKDWLNKWLEFYVRPSVKMQTYCKYETNVRLHIAPYVGDYDFKRLNAELLQQFVAELTGRYAANTVDGIITVLRKSLKAAERAGVTGNRYSAVTIVRPRHTEKKVECFTIEEQRKIERAVKADGQPKAYGIVLCLYTGLRIGELLSLRWDDVDLKNGLIYVNSACHYCKGLDGRYAVITDTPKTEFSVRVIPVAKQILPRLRELKSVAEGDYVVERNGRPLTIRAYQYVFERLLKKLKIPHRGFHSLRHTFATRAIECGVDVKTLSELLGHKNASVTMNRYTHSLLEHKRAMINKLGRLSE